MTVTPLHPVNGGPLLDPEVALLGCAMTPGTGSQALDEAESLVRPEEFYQPRHEAIWRAILAVRAEGTQPDAYTVMAKMGADAHRLPGGATYLATCLEAAMVGGDPAFLATQVAEKAANRELDGLRIRLAQLQEQDLTAAEKRELVKGWLDGMGEPRTARRHLSPREVLDEVYSIAEHGMPNGHPTPWEELNRVLSGWFPGQVIVVGARPGVGKSIFGENAATDMAAAHGSPVYMASLEMSAVEVTQRTVAQQARVNLQALRTGRMSEDDWARLDRIAGKVADLPVRIVEDAEQSVPGIRAGAAQFKREMGGLGLVVIDYLQLLQVTDRRLTRQQQIGEMTRGSKIMAKQLEVPVVLLSQLRRPDNPRQPPNMSELRESGDIEQDADVVILLHWDPENPYELQAIVEKQRSGPANITVKLQRRGHYAVLED